MHGFNIYRFPVPDNTSANNSCVLRAEIRNAGGNQSHGLVLLVV